MTKARIKRQTQQALGGKITHNGFGILAANMGLLTQRKRSSQGASERCKRRALGGFRLSPKPLYTCEVKIGALAFSFWILTLVVLPCNDDDSATGEQAVVCNAMDTTHTGLHTEFCTPFCTCQCCHVQAVVQKPTSLLHNLGPAQLYQVHVLPSLIPFLSGVWDPPEVIG